MLCFKDSPSPTFSDRLFLMRKLVATLAVMPDLPVAGVALLVGIDRFMSEARALTSVISNACAVIFVSLWEGACDRMRLAQRLAMAGPASPNGADEGSTAGDAGGNGKTL